MSEFRYRGVQVSLDTTYAAELDIKGYQISDETLEIIARTLKSVTYSSSDRVVENLRVRLIAGYDVVYLVTRQGEEVVITIAGVLLPIKSKPTEVVLQKLGIAAILRGALGL